MGYVLYVAPLRSPRAGNNNNWYNINNDGNFNNNNNTNNTNGCAP